MNSSSLRPNQAVCVSKKNYAVKSEGCLCVTLPLLRMDYYTNINLDFLSYEALLIYYISIIYSVMLARL